MVKYSELKEKVSYVNSQGFKKVPRAGYYDFNIKEGIHGAGNMLTNYDIIEQPLNVLKKYIPEAKKQVKEMLKQQIADHAQDDEKQQERKEQTLKAGEYFKEVTKDLTRGQRIQLSAGMQNDDIELVMDVVARAYYEHSLKESSTSSEEILKELALVYRLGSKEELDTLLSALFGGVKSEVH